MWAFLAQLDPNLVLAVLTGVGTVATWLYRKARGQKVDSLKDTLWHALEGVAIKLAESDATVETARSKLTAAAWEMLGRIKVPRNALSEMLVSEAVERGVTEVRKRILAKKNAAAASVLPAQLQALLDLAGQLPKAFTPPTNPTVPRLDIDVEIVKPTP